MINLKKIFCDNWKKGRLAPFTILKNEDGNSSFILDVLSEIVSLELNMPLENLSQKIRDNSLPDILFVEPEDGSKITSEDTEKIFEFTTLCNFKLKYKCIVVENAQLLNISSSNKLLKMLEDPPPFTLFIFLVAKNQRMLKTIESRAVTLTLLEQKSGELFPAIFEKLVSEFIDKKIGESELVEELKKVPNADSLLLKKVLANCINESSPNYLKIDKIMRECEAYEQSSKYANSVAERLYSLCPYL